MEVKKIEPTFKPIAITIENKQELKHLIDCLVIVNSQCWTIHGEFAGKLIKLLEKECDGN